MTTAWVLGSGGMLGAALCRALRRNHADLFIPAERNCWSDIHKFAAQMVAAVDDFSHRVGESDRWDIYWAAGIGTMSSSEESLAEETQCLAALLARVGANSRLMATSGNIVFASSAGAIYAGTSGTVITENTQPTPTTAYAREKMKQEELVRAFAIASDRMNVLIARISTLYGPGQAMGKQQGLLAHIARSILRNQPVQIFVPYDTMRDYIAADDAAPAMMATLAAMQGKTRVLTKIIASELPVTIAEIIAIFRKITRRAPRIVTSSSKLSPLYARRVQFQSIVDPASGRPNARSLLVGIDQLMTSERAAFARGPRCANR
jgi:UDP-glucose 4-epimerase